MQNKPGDPFIAADIDRARVANESLRGDVVYLTPAQQLFAQDTIPELCIRGGWVLRTCSAAHDHVHVVLDVDPATHGEKVRRLLKRWLGEALTERFGKPDSGTWSAKEGSNKAIHDEEYLNNAYRYVLLQRTAARSGIERLLTLGSPRSRRRGSLLFTQSVFRNPSAKSTIGA
jgi:hypothetical protein